MANQKQQTKQTKQMATWKRGDELPETLSADAFMVGMGLDAAGMRTIAEKTNVIPLRMMAPGQLKGWPSITVYTRSQLEKLIAAYDTVNAPKPPTPEEKAARAVDALLATTSEISANQRSLEARMALIDETISNRFVHIEKLILQLREDAHTQDFAQLPDPILAEHANEVPSQMNEQPQARLVRRHK